MTVEEFNVGALGTTYRFYVNAEDPTDKISAVFGNDEIPCHFHTGRDMQRPIQFLMECIRHL